MPGKTPLAALLGMIVVGGLGLACDIPDGKWKKPEARDVAPALPRKVPPHINNTVAQYAVLQGSAGMPVQGWGIVIGLGRNGSSEIPAALKDFLIKQLSVQGFGSAKEGLGDISPERVLADKDTAVVQVTASIPGGATVGSRFDVYVQSLPNDQTRSLEGGRLLMTDLHLPVGGPEMAGRNVTTIARAEGEVFVNPFLDPSKLEHQPQYRQGRVLGGGLVTENRVLQLQLRQASHSTAQNIDLRIRERWSGRNPTARAKNDTTVNLFVPEEYQKDYAHFLKLVMRLPIYFGNQQYFEHAQEVARAMEAPGAPYEDLAMVWEAMGQQAIPAVRKVYVSRLPKAAFCAAQVGMRLDDGPASQIILDAAMNPSSPFRLQAIEELGRHPSALAGTQLGDLLDDPNALVRMAAYRAILRRGGHPAVNTIDVGGRFFVDVVASRGPRAICVTQSLQPRITVFGGFDLPISTPVFLTTPGGLVTIDGKKGGEGIRVFRKTPRTGALSDPFSVPAKVVPLILILGRAAKLDPQKNVMGLGLTYGQVVSTLYHLCQAGDIKAEFVPEQPSNRATEEGPPIMYRPDTP
ncbi:MAG: flagellar basal body P-ring protein FlgI [Planctomycetota bacterium]|nr:flagellar basal body P-ring protein FlgI [Planctomycetota bacterium]